LLLFLVASFLYLFLFVMPNEGAGCRSGYGVTVTEFVSDRGSGRGALGGTVLAGFARARGEDRLACRRKRWQALAEERAFESSRALFNHRTTPIARFALPDWSKTITRAEATQRRVSADTLPGAQGCAGARRRSP